VFFSSATATIPASGSKAASATDRAGPTEWIYDEDRVIARSIWPRADLADTDDGWIALRSDVIYLTMLAYWFQYRSVPLRAKRLGASARHQATPAFIASPRWRNGLPDGGRACRPPSGATRTSPRAGRGTPLEVIRQAARHEA
jgi:hypothetical protein